MRFCQNCAHKEHGPVCTFIIDEKGASVILPDGMVLQGTEFQTCGCKNFKPLKKEN